MREFCETSLCLVPKKEFRFVEWPLTGVRLDDLAELKLTWFLGALQMLFRCAQIWRRQSRTHWLKLGRVLDYTCAVEQMDLGVVNLTAIFSFVIYRAHWANILHSWLPENSRHFYSVFNAGLETAIGMRQIFLKCFGNCFSWFIKLADKVLEGAWILPEGTRL